jgi:hypothetical protein
MSENLHISGIGYGRHERPSQPLAARVDTSLRFGFDLPPPSDVEESKVYSAMWSSTADFLIVSYDADYGLLRPSVVLAGWCELRVGCIFRLDSDAIVLATDE